MDACDKMVQLKDFNRPKQSTRFELPVTRSAYNTACDVMQQTMSFRGH